MKGFQRVSVLAAVGLLLGGCAGSPVEETNQPPAGYTQTASSAGANGSSSSGSNTQSSNSSVVSGGPSPSQEDSANVKSADCNVEGLSGYKGKSGNQSLYREILEKSGARIQRVLTPQSITTMDYRSDRVDIHLDGNGRITGLSCG